jgi:ribosomal protein S24E
MTCTENQNIILNKILNHQNSKKKQIVIKTMRTKYGIKTNEKIMRDVIEK